MMYPELAYPGFTWQITQHAGMTSPDLILGLLRACEHLNGKKIDIPSIDQELAKQGRIPADSDRSLWRDYQQVLSEFGFIVASAASDGTLLLTPMGKALLAGRISFQEAMTVQLMRYQYPNGFKRTIPTGVVSQLPTAFSAFETLTALQSHCGVLVRPWVLVWQVLDRLSKQSGKLESLSLDELETFVLRCKGHDDVDECCAAIVKGRRGDDTIKKQGDNVRRNAGDWSKLLLMTSVFSLDTTRKQITLSELALKNAASLQWLVDRFNAAKSFWHGEDGSSWFDYYGSVDSDLTEIVAASQYQFGWLLPSFAINYQSQRKRPEEQRVDLLTSALKLFKEKRNEFAMGEKVNEGIRAYFDPLTEEGLRNFTEEQFTDLFLGKEKYEHMWSGTNGKGWGHIKNAGREAAMNFIADLKAIPVPAEEFCDKGFDAPSGFGRVTIAELQMKFRPTEFCAYSKRTAAAFRILKLDEREFNGNFTAEDYNAILAITETVRSKMEEMGIGLTRKDASKPDYLSANEFVDFVLQNETLILQEWGKQMKHEIDAGKQEPIAGSKDFKAFIEKFHEAADKAGLTYDLDLVRRFVCAMLAKKRPFVILTGLSGSGKTKLAEAFSKWMGVEHTHMLVSVGADWTNSEKLLGFPNALEPKQYVSPDTGVLQFLRNAEQNPDVPFFLILDEMNLSHVECYFADFLSAMESSDGVIRLYDGGEREDENGVALKPAITFPKNLFIIGTMNVDETTRASSPKVLDRAQVIEFRVSKGNLAKFLDEPKELDLDSLDGQGKAYSKAFLDLHDKAPVLDKDGKTTNRDEISAALKTLFEPLAELGAEFGYRTAGEAMRFCAYDLHAGAEIVPAIDAAVMQKLLPKLHGSQARLAPVLKKIADLSEEEYEVSEEGGEKKKAKRPKYPLTHEKVGRMMVRVKANGFTGFAEA